MITQGPNMTITESILLDGNVEDAKTILDEYKNSLDQVKRQNKI